MDEGYGAWMKEQFPKMFTDQRTDLNIGKGWWVIVESLCRGIQQYIDAVNKSKPDTVEQVVVTQVKEKFGTLRFYYTGGDAYVDGMVRMAGTWSSHCCEECGDKGSMQNTGWIKTLCERHKK